MSKKLITLEQTLSFVDSINIIGTGYIELAADSNNPPTVKQNTKFSIITSAGLSRYILETGDRAFSWGTGSFPVISDGTWYLYCYEEQSLGNNLPGLGNYGASKNVPTYDQTKNGWYNSDGKVIGTFTVASSIVSGITIINNIQIDDSGNIILPNSLEVSGNLTMSGNFINPLKVSDDTDSISTSTGSITAEGGIGAKKNIRAGGIISANTGFKAIYKNSLGVQSELGYFVKFIEIGDWNMDSDLEINVDHSITDIYSIISIDVIIREDADAHRYSLYQGGNIIMDQYASYISLVRTAGGIFDSTNFNATSFNRGFICIIYL